MTIPDISHYETVLNWQTLKKDCPFLIFKGTQGTNFVDQKAYEFIAQCEANKIPYWIYTYLNKGDELDQAKFLVKTFKPYVLAESSKYFAGFCLDAEVKNDDISTLKALKWLEGAGKWKVILYTMYSQMNNFKQSIEYVLRKDKITWWEARYGLNNGKYVAAFGPHQWVSLHQYTDKGKLGYIGGQVDLNRLTGITGLSWFTETVYERRYGKNDL